MDNPKRKNSGASRLRRLFWTLLIMLPVSMCLLLVVFGSRLMTGSTQETHVTGQVAAQWIEGLMKEPVPFAQDIRYDEVKKGFDPFEATLQFKAAPPDYLAFIERAAPLCFAVPLNPEGEQATLPGERCDRVSMKITLDKSNEALWQVTIFIDSFR